MHIMRKAASFVPAESFGIRTSENRYFAALHACPLYPDVLKGVSGCYFEDAIYQMEELQLKDALRRCLPCKGTVSPCPEHGI